MTTSMTPTVRLTPHDPVQEALDRARPGDVVELAAGIFSQQLHVRRSGVTLRGAGPGRTVITPPATPAPLPAPPLHEAAADATSGVTVHDDAGLRDVSITGLTIRGFTGAGVHARSVTSLSVSDVEVVDNRVWGVYCYACSGVTVRGVAASGSRLGGVTISFSPRADASVTDCSCTGNGYGVFIDNSSHGQIRRVTASDNCSGILMLNHIFPGEPPGGVEDWLVLDCSSSGNGLSCGVDPGGLGGGGAPISGNGIALIGTRSVAVVGNRISHNAPSGFSVLPAGLAVTSSKDFGGDDPHGNLLLWNEVRDNQPLDVLVEGDATRQVLRDNSAERVEPADLAGVDRPGASHR